MPPQHPATPSTGGPLTPPLEAPLHRLSRPLYAGDPGNSVCADQAEDSVLVARASLVVTSLPRLWSSRPSRVSGRHVPRASLVVTPSTRYPLPHLFIVPRFSGCHVPPRGRLRDAAGLQQALVARLAAAGPAKTLQHGCGPAPHGGRVGLGQAANSL